MHRKHRVRPDPAKEKGTVATCGECPFKSGINYTRCTSTTFKIAMRGLLRARNIILHGGAPKSVAVKPALRAAAPLVGAGLDRVAHATLVEELAPLDLAARAIVGLRLVGGETGLSVVDLLEPPRRPVRGW